MIGIRKYEAPVFESEKLQAGKADGRFPSHIPKTDEENIFKMKWIIDELHGEEVVLSSKNDGTSLTVALDKDGVFNVCSRNNSLKEEGGGDYWNMVRKYDLKTKMAKDAVGLSIQAEIVGPGIQKNKHNLKEKEMRIHNVFNNDEGRHLDYDERLAIAAKLSVPVVQEVHRFVLDKNVHTIEKLIEMATIPDIDNPNNPIEGLVLRPVKEKRVGSRLERASVKILNPQFKEKFKNG
jgi:RNA ligase (TIGR02306 family)